MLKKLITKKVSDLKNQPFKSHARDNASKNFRKPPTKQVECCPKITKMQKVQFLAIFSILEISTLAIFLKIINENVSGVL